MSYRWPWPPVKRVQGHSFIIGDSRVPFIFISLKGIIIVLKCVVITARPLFILVWEMHMSDLTFTMENYLEAIYELSMDGDGARVSDIAEKLGVTKASTNSAMATLAKRGLIVNEKYKEIYLTPEGRKLAKATSEKHRIIRQFLIKVLKVNPAVADQDACAIEHVISGESVEAIRNFMK